MEVSLQSLYRILVITEKMHRVGRDEDKSPMDFLGFFLENPLDFCPHPFQLTGVLWSNFRVYSVMSQLAHSFCPIKQVKIGSREFYPCTL